MDEDDDDEDDDFFYNKFQTHAQELGTFFSEDLFNYYLQNEAEADAAFYGASTDFVKERVLPVSEFECENSPLNDSHSRKHLVCDNSVKFVNPMKRTIETVTEETSSMI